MTPILIGRPTYDIEHYIFVSCWRLCEVDPGIVSIYKPSTILTKSVAKSIFRVSIRNQCTFVISVSLLSEMRVN